MILEKSVKYSMKKSEKVRMTFSFSKDTEMKLRKISVETGLKMTTILEKALNLFEKNHGI